MKPHLNFMHVFTLSSFQLCHLNTVYSFQFDLVTKSRLIVVMVHQRPTFFVFQFGGKSDDWVETRYPL
jgi:hypothetical protein